MTDIALSNIKTNVSYCDTVTLSDSMGGNGVKCDLNPWTWAALKVA